MAAESKENIGKALAEEKKEFERKYELHKQRAIQMIDEMAKEGLKYSDANRILRMAQEELCSRRSDEILERTT